MFTVLSRPQVTIQDIIKASFGVKNLLSELNIEGTDVVEQAEIQMKYEGYIFREQELAKKMERLEDIVLHDDFDYRSLGSLSLEAREKLSKARPQTIGQASRISGINPADISVLLIYLGR
jgi:tRNA uridine 5-carboxymethylaminomethyl modification enzyme